MVEANEQLFQNVDVALVRRPTGRQAALSWSA
jgi:hypothetical protein